LAYKKSFKHFGSKIFGGVQSKSGIFLVRQRGVLSCFDLSRDIAIEITGWFAADFSFNFSWLKIEKKSLIISIIF